MKLLAFAASNSSQSINRQLVDYAIGLLADGEIEGVPAGALEISTLDLNDFEMPIYSIDRQEAGGIPQAAHDFYDTLGAADALLISFAEHNGSYTVAFKNVFDWASRIDMRVYHDKPIVMLSTSPGGGGGRVRAADRRSPGRLFRQRGAGQPGRPPVWRELRRRGGCSVQLRARR